MKFIIIFEDDPNANPDIRKVLMAEHLSFLEAHSEKVLFAGPLSDAGGSDRGGLWLVDAASVDEVEQLVHEDPFWPTGLRKSYSILEWKQVFANGRRLIPSN
jgi:uncharacterized protein YciI